MCPLIYLLHHFGRTYRFLYTHFMISVMAVLFMKKVNSFPILMTAILFFTQFRTLSYFFSNYITTYHICLPLNPLHFDLSNLLFLVSTVHCKFLIFFPKTLFSNFILAQHLCVSAFIFFKTLDKILPLLWVTSFCHSPCLYYVVRSTNTQYFIPINTIFSLKVNAFIDGFVY